VKEEEKHRTVHEPGNCEEKFLTEKRNNLEGRRGMQEERCLFRSERSPWKRQRHNEKPTYKKAPSCEILEKAFHGAAEGRKKRHYYLKRA